MSSLKNRCHGEYKLTPHTVERDEGGLVSIRLTLEEASALQQSPLPILSGRCSSIYTIVSTEPCDASTISRTACPPAAQSAHGAHMGPGTTPRKWGCGHSVSPKPAVVDPNRSFARLSQKTIGGYHRPGGFEDRKGSTWEGSWVIMENMVFARGSWSSRLV